MSTTRGRAGTALPARWTRPGPRPAPRAGGRARRATDGVSIAEVGAAFQAPTAPTDRPFVGPLEHGRADHAADAPHGFARVPRHAARIPPAPHREIVAAGVTRRFRRGNDNNIMFILFLAELVE